MCLQMDLEPEGKVYVQITLTGTFTDGRMMTLGPFSDIPEDICMHAYHRISLVTGWYASANFSQRIESTCTRTALT